FAHIGAEVAFQTPERDDHRRGHAEVLFDAREGRGIGLDQLLATLNAVGGGHTAGKFDEGLGEDALAAIDVDEFLIVDQMRSGGRYGALGNLLRQRLTLEGREPGVVSAARVTRGGGGRSGWRRWRCGCGLVGGRSLWLGGGLRGRIGRRRGRVRQGRRKTGG